MPCRLLVYALGGGFGHLTRACALARAAGPDVRVRILTNSPYAACVERAMPEIDLVALDPAITAARGRAAVLRQIASAAPDGLIVDTFPRGLGGELVNVISGFPGLKVFVQRDLNPHYARKYHLNAFIASYYDLVIVPGDAAQDGLGPFPQTFSTAPWLIRVPCEILPRDRARHLLALHEPAPCIVICGTGNPEELAWYGAVVSQLQACAPECGVRCISPMHPAACPPDCWVGYWPAMDLYSAADVVVGGAGYNTVYEAAACGVPLVARPWPRKYDRQNLRARRAARIVDDPSQAVVAALDLLATAPPREPQLHFENGAMEAITMIREKWLHRRGDHDIQSL